MKIVSNKAAIYKAICPHCKSELEVTEEDQYYNSFSYRKDLTCPCCGKTDSWDSFVFKESN
ncbi:MAG: hypothetical protein AAGU14_10470 [Eubacteriaceae bacterium]